MKQNRTYSVFFKTEVLEALHPPVRTCYTVGWRKAWDSPRAAAVPQAYADLKNGNSIIRHEKTVSKSDKEIYPVAVGKSRNPRSAVSLSEWQGKIPRSCEDKSGCQSCCLVFWPSIIHSYLPVGCGADQACLHLVAVGGDSFVAGRDVRRGAELEADLRERDRQRDEVALAMIFSVIQPHLVLF